jgi:hypothetical protein
LWKKLCWLIGWVAGFVLAVEAHKGEKAIRDFRRVRDWWRAKKGGAPAILLWPAAWPLLERALLDLFLVVSLMYVAAVIVGIASRWRRRRREGRDPQELKRAAERYNCDGL